MEEGEDRLACVEFAASHLQRLCGKRRHQLKAHPWLQPLGGGGGGAAPLYSPCCSVRLTSVAAIIYLRVLPCDLYCDCNCGGNVGVGSCVCVCRHMVAIQVEKGCWFAENKHAKEGLREG